MSLFESLCDFRTVLQQFAPLQPGEGDALLARQDFPVPLVVLANINEAAPAVFVYANQTHPVQHPFLLFTVVVSFLWFACWLRLLRWRVPLKEAGIRGKSQGSIFRE